MTVLAFGASLPGIAHADEPSAPDKVACAAAAESAQALRAQNRWIEARKKLGQCVVPSCPEVIRSDCSKWLSELDTSMPTIVVQALDADGKDMLDVRVFVDGVLVSEELDAKPIPLDPGRHRLRFVAGHGRSQESQLLAAPGQRNRLVSVRFDAEPAAARAEPDDSAGPPTLAYVMGAVGLLGIGVFAGFEIVGQIEYSKLKNGCAETRSCEQGDVDRVRTEFRVAGVALGIGAASLAVAAGIWLWAPRSEVAVGVTPRSDGAQATFNARF